MVTHLEGVTGILCDLFHGSDKRNCACALVNDIVYVSLYCVLLAFERGRACGPDAVATCQGARAAPSAAPFAAVVASALSTASASSSASVGSGDIPR